MPADDDSRFAPPPPDDDDVLPAADDTDTDAPDDEHALAEDAATGDDEFLPPEDTPETDDIDDTPDDKPRIRVADSPADLDVDSALAAVSGLDDIVAEQEAEEQAERERQEAEARRLQMVREAEEAAREKAQSEEDRVQAILDNPLPTPGALTLERFGTASLLPGLALLTVGIWLTAAYAMDAAPSPLVVSAVLGGLAVLALVSVWMASGRWSRGAFFFAGLAVLTAGAGYLTLREFGATLLPAAVLGAAGVTFLLTGLLTRPADRGLILPRAGVTASGGHRGGVRAGACSRRGQPRSLASRGRGGGGGGRAASDSVISSRAQVTDGDCD